MNTVIFSDYDSAYRSSALLLRDNVDWGLINKYMYKEQIPDAEDIADYDDEKLFTFSSSCLMQKSGGLLLKLTGTFIRCAINAREDFSGIKWSTGKFGTTKKRLTNAEQ